MKEKIIHTKIVVEGKFRTVWGEIRNSQNDQCLFKWQAVYGWTGLNQVKIQDVPEDFPRRFLDEYHQAISAYLETIKAEIRASAKNASKK